MKGICGLWRTRCDVSSIQIRKATAPGDIELASISVEEHSRFAILVDSFEVCL